MKNCPHCGNKKSWQYSSGQERYSHCGLTRKFYRTVQQRIKSPPKRDRMEI